MLAVTLPAARSVRPQAPRQRGTVCCAAPPEEPLQSSRRVALALAPLALVSLAGRPSLAAVTAPDRAKYEYMPALEKSDFGKPRITYPDFTLTPSGLQYKDLKEGTGAVPKSGSRVAVDWDGYTIGYYGRPFQARNKAKGGAFSSESNEYLRFKVGDGTVIGAFDEAVRGMRVGGVRRVVIGPGPLFYPSKGARKLLPQPSTFSGERALYFVLENQGLIDKTLLFDLELKYVE